MWPFTAGRSRANIPATPFVRGSKPWASSTLISTDISRDGAMKGANLSLYRHLSEEYAMQTRDLVSAVSSMEDVEALANMGLYGAIIGKAYYTGAIDLRRAIEVAT